jgi:hypothetical protein
LRKIAALATTYFPASHADVILSRWIDPFPADKAWGWERPGTSIASLYVAQSRRIDARTLPEGPAPMGKRERREELDLAPYYAETFAIPLCSSVRESLMLGSDSLAVDGILMVGEHGDYPLNAYGQKLYPRKALFDEIVAVFRETGRSVPIFVDKHLSWNTDWAEEMVATARELRFPLMAGSNLTHTGYTTPIASLENASITEYIGLFYAGTEIYGFHSLELMQALIERRAGGESGITALTVLEGEAVWEVADSSLFAAALSAAPLVVSGDLLGNLKSDPARPHAGLPIAFLLEFTDGLCALHIRLHGHLNSFSAALRTTDGRVFSTAPLQGEQDDHYGHFAALNKNIERMFLTGIPPAPIERTLLTTKTIAACMHALQIPGKRILTPELEDLYIV